MTYSYDEVGNRTQMTDGEGTETRTYDDLSRLTQVTRGTDSFSYQYDAASNLTKRTYPDSTVIDLTYDDDERLASLVSGGATTSYAYDAAGNLTTTTLPSGNGYEETRSYDRAGRLNKIENTKGTTVLSKVVYARDENGNPLTQNIGAHIDTFTYDQANRITEVCGQLAACDQANDPFIRFAYDTRGNRVTETRPAGVTSYAYNGSNQLLATSGQTIAAYAYDANGNRITAGGTSYGYDRANRTTSVNDGTTTWNYSYDGDGVRADASDGTSTTNYLWDRSGALPELALERDGQNNLIRRYVEDQRGPHSMSTTSATSYYHLGAVGSVTDVTSSSGAHQWDYRYDAFGNSTQASDVSGSAPDNPVRFSGEYLDPTGLYHLRARQYDPTVGAFTATDPVTPGVGDPYISQYLYVGQQPTVYVDPSGEVSVRDIGRGAKGAGSALVDTAKTLAPAAECGLSPLLPHRVHSCVDLTKDQIRTFQQVRREHGLNVAINYVANPGFHLLANLEGCIRSVRAGDVYRAGRKCTFAGVAAAETVGVAVGGGAGAGRLRPRAGSRARIIEQDGDAVHIAADLPSGTISVFANMERRGTTLYLRKLHIDGAGPGTVGISALRSVARDIGRGQGVKTVVIQGGVRTTGARPGRRPRSITIQVR